MNDAKHTPLPWAVNTDPRYHGGDPWLVWGPHGPGYGAVCEICSHCPDDAELIVRAVNSHAELVAVARLALVMFCDPHTLSIDPAARNLKAMAEAAIAKAGAA